MALTNSIKAIESMNKMSHPVRSALLQKMRAQINTTKSEIHGSKNVELFLI
jgi:hypothetical protein